MILQKSLAELFSGIVLSHCERYARTPLDLKMILQAALLRLIDSKMIIEDSFEAFTEFPLPKISQPLTYIENDARISEILDKIEREGFGKYFYELTSQLGLIMLQFCASKMQKQHVNSWGMQGYKGVFLMTDKGGPYLASWISECVEIDGKLQLNIQKLWGIAANQAQFCIVNVRKGTMMAPLAFLLGPEKYQALKKYPIGVTFLDQQVQLGNVEGSVIVDTDEQLSASGISGISRFLSLARPRFVLSVLAHLRWLIKNNRLLLDKRDENLIEYLQFFAEKIIARKAFDRYSIDEVLSLKLLNNEVLLDFVVRGLVPVLSDQRDLLALAKMEGSSYRCLYEIYMKTGRTKKI